MIRATPEAFSLAAFLLRALPEEHHGELRSHVPEAAALQWVKARARWPRKEVAEAMAVHWGLSRATAYRCLACIDGLELPAEEGTAA